MNLNYLTKLICFVAFMVEYFYFVISDIIFCLKYMPCLSCSNMIRQTSMMPSNVLCCTTVYTVLTHEAVLKISKHLKYYEQMTSCCKIHNIYHDDALLITRQLPRSQCRHQEHFSWHVWSYKYVVIKHRTCNIFSEKYIGFTDLSRAFKSIARWKGAPSTIMI